MAAAKIEIYTWTTCPFCLRAKALLDSKGAAYTEFDITGDEDAREKMAAKSNGRRTVPQIFINGQWIGGCDDLHMMDAEGKLDSAIS
jgi:glutaredoxin 3